MPLIFPISIRRFFRSFPFPHAQISLFFDSFRYLKSISGEMDDDCNNFNKYNEVVSNDFPLRFSDGTQNDDFLDDGDVDDDFSTTPSFEVYEKVEVHCGMLVSTRQVADTFFHQVAPSEIAKVYLIPAVMHNYSTIKADSPTKPKSKGLFGKTVSPMITIMALLLNYYCLYFGDQSLEDEKLRRESLPASCSNVLKSRERDSSSETVAWDYRKRKIWFVEKIIGERISCVALKKILWAYLTIALAICSIWVHHIEPNCP